MRIGHSLRSSGSQELSCFSRNSNSLIREAFDEQSRLHGVEREKLIKAIRIFLMAHPKRLNASTDCAALARILYAFAIPHLSTGARLALLAVLATFPFKPLLIQSPCTAGL
jgi:hypothetical protein